jgi:uncharacterized protein YfdQ (DUF2303 family)
MTGPGQLEQQLAGASVVKSLTDLGAAIAKPQVISGPGNVPFVVVPQGFEVQELPRPDFSDRPGNPATFDDPVSFSRYFQDHGTPVSRVYASAVNSCFVAVLDEYARPFGTAEQPHGEGVFAYREWRAVYQPALSPQWLDWKGSDGTAMNQTEFATFLEDHLPDIVDPDGSDLMALALNLEISSSGKFASTQRQRDGSAKLEYRNELQQVGQVELPAQIRLLIPIYRHQPPVTVQAHLRFRLHGAGLSLHYQLIRPERAVEQAFEDLITLVGLGCTLEGQPSPILRGHV